MSRTCAVILNWNQAELALVAAASVRDEVDEVILIDNGSSPDQNLRLATAAETLGYTLIQSETNLGYAAGNNLAFTPQLLAQFEYFLVMNSDAAALPGAVERLRADLEDDPRVAAAIPTVVAPDTSTVHHTSCSLHAVAGRGRWDEFGMSHEAVSPERRDTDYVSGEAVLMRAAAIRQCGGFDPRFFCYFEDAEWSVRVRRAGWLLVVVPAATFTHIVGASGVGVFGSYYRARNHVLFQRIGLRRSRITAGCIGALLLMRPVWRALVRRRDLAAVRALASGWAAGVTFDVRRTT